MVVIVSGDVELRFPARYCGIAMVVCCGGGGKRRTAKA
jgi:hypothetical protein